ncbi:hypothetical protein WN943_005424 [Citrus x changshan-huyou]
MAGKEEEPKTEARDELAESLNDLFTSVSAMVKSELQGTNNTLELLEKMNLRVAEEYKGFGDVAAGLRVFVEQLKKKSGSFDEYVQQIDSIEQQVTQFEAYDKLWEAELWLSFLVGCWEPPPDGWFKLNVDAAVDGDRGLVGFGAWRRVMVAGVNQASLVYNFDFAEVEDLQFAIGRRIGFLSCDSIGVE